MKRILAFTSRYHRLLSSSSSPGDTSIQRVFHIVASDAGSLDDMSAALDRSGVAVTPGLIDEVIDTCSNLSGISGSRRVLRFFSWCQRQIPPAQLGDDVFNRAIRALARMKDLTAMGIAVYRLQDEGRSMALETFALVVDALVRSGQEEESVRLFASLERARLLQTHHDDGACSGILALVHALCARGHAGMARGVLWRHRRELLSAGGEATRIVYQSLLHGWCVRGNAREARRILDEMKSLGFRPSIASYSDLLLCVCRRNVKFNPSALVPEATNLMTEMRTSGVPPTTASFNILLSCLSRVRRVKEAYGILHLMRQDEAKCSPDWASYHIVIRLMFLSGRFSRGNELVDEMLEAGMLPDACFYHSLVGLLCGLEKVDHALQLFERMKRYSGQCHGPTYDLLIAKLSRNGKFEQATNLWEEAIERSIKLQCLRDLLDPSKCDVFRPVAPIKKLRPQNFQKVSKNSKKGFLGTRESLKRRRAIQPNGFVVR